MDLLNDGENGKNELNQTIHNLLKEIEILESNIMEKSETILNVTTSMNLYHDAISNHINEVLYDNLIYYFCFLSKKFLNNIFYQNAKHKLFFS